MPPERATHRASRESILAYFVMVMALSTGRSASQGLEGIEGSDIDR